MPVHDALAAPSPSTSRQQAVNIDAILVAFAAALFALPAILALAQSDWRSEAGSLAPIVLALGCWSLWRQFQRWRDLAAPGAIGLWAPVVALAVLLALFAAAIDMPSLQAFAAWLGCCGTFYARFGSGMLHKCAFPLLFLGLLIPLPYTLSMPANAYLRQWVAEWSVWGAWTLGFDVAIERDNVIVGPFVLAVEDACAGASSTLTLVAVGLLYAFWSGGGWRRMIALGLISIPVALFANIGRVIALMILVDAFGGRVIDSWAHPFSGIVSFVLALTCLLAISALFEKRIWSGGR